MQTTGKKENEMKQLTDEALVLAAKADKPHAMETLLLRYAGMVRRIARGYFLSGGDTDDLVQEGMIGLYSAVVDYKGGDMQFKSFAYLCIMRRILDAVKASGREKNRPLNNYVSLLEESVGLAQKDPLQTMIDRENDEEFFRRMNEVLSDLEFRVLMLYMKGLSTAEICTITKKNEKGVDNALQRSKKKLQAVMQKRKD